MVYSVKFRTLERFPFYSLFVLKKKILDFFSVIISLKLHEEILPAVSGRHNMKRKIIPM